MSLSASSAVYNFVVFILFALYQQKLKKNGKIYKRAPTKSFGRNLSLTNCVNSSAFDSQFRYIESREFSASIAQFITA